ncbi:hypothetical protein BKA64DRAFT_645136 [Cadophora sp. MPI-SDFR-AT-0126]|nr:hypothetical protein BKA64DRAFT_645136 [Leotiomycetes sp. MPI-SDFR-AT-0126]
MPKDWLSQKENFKKLYVTEDRSLEDVRGILKDRYGFDASTRSYRMKIDEWNMRKYKPKKDFKTQRASTHPRSKLGNQMVVLSTGSQTPTSHINSRISVLLDGDSQKLWGVDNDTAMHNSLSIYDRDSVSSGTAMLESCDWDGISGSWTVHAHNQPQIATSPVQHSTDHRSIDNPGFAAHPLIVTSDFEIQDDDYQFNLMLKSWKDGHGVKNYVETVLPVLSSKITLFQTEKVEKVDLFDLICLKVIRSERAPLIKDFLRSFAESNPHTPTAQYILWRSAFNESDWSRYKRAIGLVNLEGCLSLEASRLVLRATSLLVGERLIDTYRARFDMADRLGSTATNSAIEYFQEYLTSPWYFRDRQQYDAMLLDFRLNCAKHWEE